MYIGIAITTLLVVAVTLARLLKDLLIVRLIRTLTRDGALSKRQRFEICTRLASALGTSIDSADHSGPPEHAGRLPARRDQVNALAKQR
jgi:hypothetical protein